MLKAVYGLPYRQTVGFAQSILALLEAEVRVPDYSLLCKRSAGLEISLPRRQAEGPKHIVVDSTGLKIYGEGEWKVRQHGYSKRRTWRKLHLSADESTQELQAVVLTEANVDDAEAGKRLIRETPGELKQVSGGASRVVGKNVRQPQPRANNQHTFGARARPTHTRAGESGFELFAGAFTCTRVHAGDGTGANGKAIGAEMLVAHPTFMVFEVLGLIRQISPRQGLGKAPGFPLKQRRLPAFVPGRGFVGIVWVKRMGGIGQLFSGMIPIDDLFAIGEVIRRQIPDPRRPISRDAGAGGSGDIGLDDQMPKRGGKTFHFAQHGGVIGVDESI
jgi:hypothetical protein